MRLITVLFIIPFIFLGCISLPKKNIEQEIRIDVIKIYDIYMQRGFTTVGAYTYFDDISKENVKQITVSKEDKERIEQILNNAEKNKHHQTKFGTKNIFCEIIFLNQHSQHRVVITGLGVVYNIWGKIKEQRMFIVDLTSMMKYKITNPSDLKWLSNFSAKIAKREK